MESWKTPPGFASPYHVHHRENEAFYVVEGELAVICDGKWIEAIPGTAAERLRTSASTSPSSKSFRRTAGLLLATSGTATWRCPECNVNRTKDVGLEIRCSNAISQFVGYFVAEKMFG